MSVGYYLCIRCGEAHPVTSSAVCPNQFSQMVVRADTVTRTDLSQASVAAALDAAATLSKKAGNCFAWQIENDIRALITPDQHDALAAHVAAEVAKARAEDNLRAHDLIAGARIGLDTGAASFSETVNFAPETITAILNMLDKAIVLIGAKP